FHLVIRFFFSSRRRHTRSVSAFLLNRSSDLEARINLRLGKVTVADVLAAQPVTTNLLKFMRASIKMIGVSNLQSFIASMTQKLRSEERRVGKECKACSRQQTQKNKALQTHAG